MKSELLTGIFKLEAYFIISKCDLSAMRSLRVKVSL